MANPRGTNQYTRRGSAARVRVDTSAVAAAVEAERIASAFGGGPADWRSGPLERTLNGWAANEDDIIRSKAAEHHQCPPEMLAYLSTDEASRVRRAVAQNPATPPSVLADLVWDDNDLVAGDAIENPSCPVDVLTTKSINPTWHHRCVANPNCPPEVLVRLVETTNMNLVARKAREHPNYPG